MWIYSKTLASVILRTCLFGLCKSRIYLSGYVRRSCLYLLRPVFTRQMQEKRPEARQVGCGGRAMSNCVRSIYGVSHFLQAISASSSETVPWESVAWHSLMDSCEQGSQMRCSPRRRHLPGTIPSKPRAGLNLRRHRCSKITPRSRSFGSE